MKLPAWIQRRLPPNLRAVLDQLDRVEQQLAELEAMADAAGLPPVPATKPKKRTRSRRG